MKIGKSGQLFNKMIRQTVEVKNDRNTLTTASQFSRRRENSTIKSTFKN
jgi:hypothetical protein